MTVTAFCPGYLGLELGQSTRQIAIRGKPQELDVGVRQLGNRGC